MALFALHYVAYLPVWNCHQAHLNMAVSLPHFLLPGTSKHQHFQILHIAEHICCLHLFEFNLRFMVTCLLYMNIPWIFPWAERHYTWPFRRRHLAPCCSAERNQNVTVRSANGRLFHCSPVQRGLASYHPSLAALFQLWFLLECLTPAADYLLLPSNYSEQGARLSWRSACHMFYIIWVQRW